MAEYARIVTIKNLAEQSLASERQAGADGKCRAKTARVAAEAQRVTIPQWGGS